MTQPKAIGRIDRDTLRYHGSHPFSLWGKTWKRALTDVPIDAAYAIYDHYVRKTGVLPVPPLTFVSNWTKQRFRILKTENHGDQLVALYKHSEEFELIIATRKNYEVWLEKQAELETPTPPFYKED